MRYFNTEGLCNPNKHYMVDITDRLVELRKMIDAGKYFVINRGRQYGKTTTLVALEKNINNDTIAIRFDFQALGNASFRTEGDFVQALARLMLDKYEFEEFPIPDEYIVMFEKLNDKDSSKLKLDDIFRVFRRWCKKEELPIVLIIDEVDSATNNQVFLDFLAQLRYYYLERENNPEQKTFQSVILAGVTDIKHLKSKIRDEDQKKVNSPWNIAVDFNVDMSLSEEGIKGMLDEYEKDHDTGMDIERVAKVICNYTSGYPYLVSKICQIIDRELVVRTDTENTTGTTAIQEKRTNGAGDSTKSNRFETLSEAWSEEGVDEAVKRILSNGSIPLFESLTGKLTNKPELKERLRRILLLGDAVDYVPYDDDQKQLALYGFVKIVNNKLIIANRIFEMLLYRQFIGETKYDDLLQMAASDKNIFIENGILNVPKIMEHFISSQKIIRGEMNERFIEEEGRERFLTYLSPIINGTGTYSIEEQTRDRRRMDVVIHYLGKRYVIELKIWRGERYKEEGEEQLKGYLDYFGLDTGYLLSFNFNESKNPGVERLQVDGKVLYEGIV